MGRGTKNGEGGRWLTRLPLLWQWLLVFAFTVMVLRHWKWLNMSSPLEDEAASSRGKGSRKGLLPGHDADAGGGGGGGGTDVAGKEMGEVQADWRVGGGAGNRVTKKAATPPRGCPVSVPWDQLPRDPGKKRAAVFTPYNIVFGGGERYLLSVVAVLQDMKYNVDVLVFRRNVCQTKEQLLKVAAGLRVALNPDLLSIHVVGAQGIHLQAPTTTLTEYSVFMSLGNDKLPTYAGLGHVSFYMCQFPFDLVRPPRPGTTKAFASYDYVLLNSEYTDRWYHEFAGPHIENALRVWNAAPTVVVLHPPVEPFNKPPAKKAGAGEAGAPPPPPQPDRQHIVLLGRFFKGRQSKGHAAAIDIFRQLMPKLPAATQLHLIGNLMPGHKDYLQDLKKRAKGLPVHFHIGVPSETIEELLRTSLVQWHLTGIELVAGAEDPASEEHFGISIAEGMSAGVIPVVLNRGGVTDIVKHGTTGFLCQDAAEVAELTEGVFGLDDDSRRRLRGSATAWVDRFSQKAFAKNFRILANRGKLSKPFRFLQQQTMDLVLARSFKLPKSAKNAALIIEPRQHYAFEYVVKNVMFHLGPEWALHVYHGTANNQYVHRALASLENVNYHELDTVGVSIAMLNQLLKSSDFWEELQEAGLSHVLFFQTDSLLVHGNISAFLQYDYVGAPWHRGNERWGRAQKRMPHGVGNGGLSLRSVPAMMALARQHGNNHSNAQQEDFFYSELMEALPEYQLPPRQQAYQFCVEVPCDDIEAEAGGVARPGSPVLTLPGVPMALHATWYYFVGQPKRYADLLTLLDMSVCGPEAFMRLRTASASPTPELKQARLRKLAAQEDDAPGQ
ncbi:expressed protein [Chlorella variabilis]|uniref:Expressed protein n=1 Tax=Chlorella variabilis TaxID=554065 RepID=E1ZCC6_CHLVA|nr:expressed protein [Chlorella variabilis]EFN56792.1 expressed protein [Chlorella variabilis]|eukprot:XP_005848894.1 expressed protein [Chlorella variabilis]